MRRKLGEKLREYREKSGLTLDDVAKRLGCTYQAVQKWEAGTARPRTDKLRRLAWLYGVPASSHGAVSDGCSDDLNLFKKNCCGMQFILASYN
jgi:transcriptional regulator with XRE-family HTH domain